MNTEYLSNLMESTRKAHENNHKNVLNSTKKARSYYNNEIKGRGEGSKGRGGRLFPITTVEVGADCLLKVP